MHETAKSIRNDRDGPRERILCRGGDELWDAELLALVLGSGTAGRPVLQVALQALQDAGGLRRLAARSAAELTALEGVGPARAARLMALFTLARRLHSLPFTPGFTVRSGRDVFAHYQPLLRDRKKEFFFTLHLDGKHRLLREERVSQGSLTAAIVHPREVFHTAVRESAATVLVAHNHPSGDPTPSREDYEITARLKEAGELLGIPLLDHVVLGDGAYVSFREEGLMPW